MRINALAALLPLWFTLGACNGTPSHADAGSLDGTLDAPADVGTDQGPMGCAAVCASATAQCPLVAMADCITHCEPGHSPLDGGVFNALGCLSAAAGCEAIAACLRGPPSVPFSTGPYGTNVRDVAAPFVLPTSDGDWTFQTEWTGDDSYVFLVYAPGALVDASGADYSLNLFTASVLDVITNSPPNVHYFFIPRHTADQAGLDAFRAQALSDLGTLSTDLQSHWRGRFHFATTALTSLTGNWINTMLTARAAARRADNAFPYDVFQFAIDRFQRIREVGQLGTLNNMGGTLADMTYAGFEPTYYNFEWAREQQLAAENATVVPMITAGTTGGTGAMNEATIDTTLTLPDAVLSGAFDSMETDLTMSCPDHVDGHCSAWDYTTSLLLCDSTDPTSPCTREVARWISSYWREGRWVTDVSGMLAVVKQPGAHRFRWQINNFSNQTYHVDLSLRFFNRHAPATPTHAQMVYAGDVFNPTAANPFGPVQFTVPADATRVQIYALLTGHGGVGSLACAEFCNTTHRFAVNGGTPAMLSFPMAGTPTGCTQQVANGAVPNQFGTWYYGRDGWCPGLDVKPYVVDITSQVHHDGTTPDTLTYTALLNGHAPNNQSGNIIATVWLVYSH